MFRLSLFRFTLSPNLFIGIHLYFPNGKNNGFCEVLVNK